VLLVLSGAAAPYKEAEAEATVKLKAAGHTVETVQLGELGSATGVELGARAGLFFAVGTEAATWLNQTLTPTAPLAYCMVTDPVAAGLSGPRLVAGVRIDTPLSEQVELICEALPDAKRIGVLYRSDNAASKVNLEAMRKAAAAVQRTVEAVAVNDHAGSAAAIEAMMARGVDVVWTCADASVYEPATIKSLLLTSLRRKVPVFGFSAAFVRSGALLGLSVDAKAQGATAGELAVKLLADPAIGAGGIGRAAGGASAPVGANAKVVVNLVVAENIDIKLPKALIDRAAQVQRP
jgi:putative ABC transport system substrate-binding protein